MLRVSATICCLSAACWAAAATAAPLSPYGVCAHLGGGQEYADLERELELMQAASIGWARADFTWAAIEPADGRFDFAAYDRVVTAALARGVTPLPILCYDSPWAGLAHANLPAWTRFVETVVRRYGDRLRHWEVWNEPNIEFWKPRPDPAQYAALLKATYATIKRVDPGMEVLYGGTAGIPLDFIRKTLEQGAGACFDIMAVHPYSYPDTPAAGGRLQELAALRALLTEFKAPTRLWITETGWPTHHDPDLEDYLPLWQSLVATAAQQVFPGRLGWNVAVLGEDGYEPSTRTAAALGAALNGSGRFNCRPLSVTALAAGLAVADTQILIGPIGESFLEPAFAGMVEFVRQGGLLVHVGGVPFYYTANRAAGAWAVSPHSAAESFRQALHIGWKAWWTEPGLSEEAGSTRLAAPDLAITLPTVGLKTTRWFTEAALKGNDRMVPLLAGYNGDTRVGYPSVLYRLDSDLRGAVLVNCLPLPLQRGVDPQTQARRLSLAYLTYLAHGVEVFFWYEFRDGGQQADYNEHNFGMVTHDLQPKPAYAALQHLTTQLGPYPRLEQPAPTDAAGLTTLTVSGSAARPLTVHWAERPGASAPAPAAGAFRAYDALWQAAPMQGDANGLRIPLDAGPVFVVPLPK
jgi:hypothetical protein